jgi:hypothetical protein
MRRSRSSVDGLPRNQKRPPSGRARSPDQTPPTITATRPPSTRSAKQPAGGHARALGRRGPRLSPGRQATVMMLALSCRMPRPEGHDTWGDQPPLQVVPRPVAGPRRPAQPHLAVGRRRRPRARVRLPASGRAGRGRHHRPQPLGVGLPGSGRCARLDRIDGRAWRRTASLADAANADGEFVTLRGFEWSHFLYGHMNIWGSQRFTDPLRTCPTM